MTIRFHQIMKDLENPNEIELEELAKVLNFFDAQDIDYDLDPPTKEITALTERSKE